MQTLLITGGAGFIGGNFVHHLLAGEGYRVVNLDALTYAGNRDTLAALENDPRHVFVEGDIGDRDLVADQGKLGKVPGKCHCRSTRPCDVGRYERTRLAHNPKGKGTEKF